MSWLGQNGASRDDFYALADAYKAVYMQQDLQEDPGYDQNDDTHNAKGEKLEDGKKKSDKKDNRQQKVEKDSKGGAVYTREEYKDPIKQALESDKKLMKLHTKDKPAPKGYTKEEADLLVALADAYGMMYEKKKDSDKCGEGTYWDKEEKKCKSKKKSGGGGRAIFYGGHSHSHDDDDNDNDGGSDAGAAGDAAGGGGGGE